MPSHVSRIVPTDVRQVSPSETESWAMMRSACSLPHVQTQVSQLEREFCQTWLGHIGWLSRKFAGNGLRMQKECKRAIELDLWTEAGCHKVSGIVVHEQGRQHEWQRSTHKVHEVWNHRLRAQSPTISHTRLETYSSESMRQNPDLLVKAPKIVLYVG